MPVTAKVVCLDMLTNNNSILFIHDSCESQICLNLFINRWQLFLNNASGCQWTICTSESVLKKQPKQKKNTTQNAVSICTFVLFGFMADEQYSSQLAL